MPGEEPTSSSSLLAILEEMSCCFQAQKDENVAAAKTSSN